MSKRRIILDTETTGLYAEGDDYLAEFAGLEMISRQMTDNSLHLYIHPERDIPGKAARVHGLTIEVLEEKSTPPFAKVGRQIADFIHDTELIVHNAKFDIGFLNMEFRRMGLPSIEELGYTMTDTLAMAREMFPGQKASLDALCSRLSVDRSKRMLHDALVDCELLGEMYLAMARQQLNLMGGEREEDEEIKSVIIAGTKHLAHLKVIEANAEELAAHEQYLDGLDEAYLWRRAETAGAEVRHAVISF